MTTPIDFEALAAAAVMVSNFVRILPQYDPKAPNWRFRLERADGDMAQLSEERVLPEKLQDPNAQFTEPGDVFWLKRDEAVWLRNMLDAMLKDWPEED
jgi:hypothetical protein